MTEKTPIILPSEIWAREFDAKLLLACCLVEKGYPVYVGCKNTMHLNITDFPSGLYVAKDFRVSSDTMFDILKKLGHTIMAWDEEATLPFDADEYHTIRISPKAFSQVTAFFAWGPVNKETLEAAPYPLPGPVHLTGNPRRDMLRREIRDYFAKDVEALKQRYGRFILINSNFGKLNHYLKVEVIRPGDVDDAMRGQPNSPKFEKKGELKLQLYHHFIEMLPQLAAEFPDLKIIVRPHPSESHQSWKDAAKGYDNVEVLYEGHVYPWLMASDVMIHSGCTTGLEGYMLEKPVLSYQPVTSEQAKQNLPNQLSHRVYNYDALISAARQYLAGELKAGQSPDRDALVDPIICDAPDRLASDQIADLIDEHFSGRQANGHAALSGKLSGWVKAKVRAAKKRMDWMNPNHKSSREFDLHRFPLMSADQVREGVGRFQKLLDRFDGVNVSPVRDNVFLLEKG